MSPKDLYDRLRNNSIVLTQDERDAAARDVLELHNIKLQVFASLTNRMGITKHSPDCSGNHETEDNGFPMQGGRCLDKAGRLL